MITGQSALRNVPLNHARAPLEMTGVGGMTAVVTGASSGIGRAIAVELARRGTTVIAVARRTDPLQATVERCRRRAPGSQAVVADVSMRSECKRVVTEAVRQVGRIDILVNNAGVGLHKQAADTTVEDIEHVMQTNFFGAVHMTSAVLPPMLERRHGHIINVTSVAGHLPLPEESAYCASKAALSAWTQSLALDLASSGVHVGELSPGPIDTEIWQKASAEYPGHLYPPRVIAVAVAKMLEEKIAFMTVPRRFGAPGAVYPLLSRPMRWGLQTFSTHRTPSAILGALASAITGR